MNYSRFSLTSIPLFQELFSRIAQALQQKSSSLQDLSSVEEPSSSSTIDIKKIEAGVIASECMHFFVFVLEG